ncbi:tyrosine-type recombinase/integrase [Caenimonas koreensis DSM 17982]|uniref:Tyrosine-type recombinase/integrase n=1 Tax=Caenimonas koreensis DSM 17982 TaxID=1121255 RepID=A0A844ANW2_9BURK|nr:integrase arm-type DNA-binding domain-containing protein [Caenimonas koreensis]MRD45650.1 tyrosine-type recombinase/integrase [Caenimonas koreensis DSM 17982]
MPLTDTAIKKAKPGPKPVKLSDGQGLYLLVTETGSKLWRWKYRVDGKEKVMALGAYPDVGLAQARDAMGDARKLQASGADPMVRRKADKVARKLSAENSFAAVARLWWAHWKATRSDSHTAYVIRRLEADVFPAIGTRPVDAIEAPELVAMVKAIAERGALDIAKRALQTTGQVFRYAIAHGKAKRNPAADIKPGDILPARKKVNYARLDTKELPELLRHIESYQGAAVTRLAIKLMALTFVRTSELIGARWEEFDLDAKRWDIPAERMKMKTPHIVPLSAQAVNILKALHLISGHSPMVFPGERDHSKPMSNNTILGALARMGYKGRMTGHGFRGIASTLLHEMGFNHAHIELQLAHQERDAVSAAYNHATYLRERAKMMQQWADYLDNCTTGKVLTFKRKAA